MTSNIHSLTCTNLRKMKEGGMCADSPGRTALSLAPRPSAGGSVWQCDHRCRIAVPARRLCPCTDLQGNRPPVRLCSATASQTEGADRKEGAPDGPLWQGTQDAEWKARVTAQSAAPRAATFGCCEVLDNLPLHLTCIRGRMRTGLGYALQEPSSPAAISRVPLLIQTGASGPQNV